MPTFDNKANANVNSDGLNEADEMNLYQPNPQLDAPFGYSDLEWLYRKQDVDGSSLNSRLAQLAPISFTNTIDGQRRRRLYSIDTWETNNFVWANDNPVTATFPNGFPNNSRFGSNANTSFKVVNTATPSLAQRDKKVNLNYPLPLSNDPDEPVRKKWITDAYYLLKTILPPLAVDSPEELAQLSQYVINIIDFRDTDSTMTHWVNPDVYFRPATATLPPILVPAANKLNTDIALDQYGMESTPIAINEVLAYSFRAQGGGATPGPTPTPRFFIELVNTLPPPASGITGTPNNACVIDLSGFLSNGTSVTNPWDNACWDLVFT